MEVEETESDGVKSDGNAGDGEAKVGRRKRRTGLSLALFLGWC